MSIEFGTTQELINTQFAPVAALMAYYEAQQVLEPLQSITSASPRRGFDLPGKLEQVVWSMLTGCEYISMVNTRLRSERKLAEVKRITCFADQSTLSRGLNGLTQMNLEQLRAAVRQINHRSSHTERHDWRGLLQLDFDLSGLPCGKQAEGASKGYFGGKKTPQAGS